MAIGIEIRERQKHHLQELLELKKLNEGAVVNGLQKALERAVGVMEQEDVAIIEKIVGVKALD